ncbi:diaminopimelate decarboxylase isoform X2 [Nematostella vectensis]|uniref:diaminopimelate decarboxylase isoform X2 n=1 Tax=Nematostella vectensis TaxID=45351 RepID=UPI00138FAA7D|nr:diaminopimelate decarboxylase isoform X2 [Nematostella vectensis]
MSGKTAPKALAEAVAKGIIGESETLTYESGKKQPVGLFYDLDEFEANVDRVTEAFGQGCLHAIAVKANPVPALLDLVNKKGQGAECASIGEVLNALKVGFPAERIVYDSPVKTRPELKFLMEQGVHLNVDNFQELQVITELMKELKNVKSTIGLRINPVMDAGDIKALSVSCTDSKFAVALTESTRDEIIGWFVDRPWMNCVHVHVGSQSYGVEGLSEGARRAVDLALAVNKKVGRNQVEIIDIGGGMGVNREDDSISPTYQDYVNALKKAVPQLFPDQGVFKQLVTEFGQSLNAKTGFIVSRVEYTKKVPESDHTIALIHAGADMCLRSCYCPQVAKYKRRVQVFDSNGKPKTGQVIVLKMTKSNSRC